jgi:hypothetical protein
VGVRFILLQAKLNVDKMECSNTPCWIIGPTVFTKTADSAHVNRLLNVKNSLIFTHTNSYNCFEQGYLKKS